MIEIGKTIISQELLQKRFVCDLTACKGACCVEGDGGAPVLDSEVNKLEEVYPIVKKYLPQEGIDAIEAQGTVVVGDDNELETPLVLGKECAFTIFEDDGTAKCGIEKAYLNGEVSFRKPESCSLYPVRLSELGDMTAVNYHHWLICKPACECGDKLDVKTYKFLKKPLIDKFGEEWFDTLEAVDKEFFSKK